MELLFNQLQQQLDGWLIPMKYENVKIRVYRFAIIEYFSVYLHSVIFFMNFEFKFLSVSFQTAVQILTKKDSAVSQMLSLGKVSKIPSTGE